MYASFIFDYMRILHIHNAQLTLFSLKRLEGRSLHYPFIKCVYLCNEIIANLRF